MTPSIKRDAHPWSASRLSGLALAATWLALATGEAQAQQTILEWRRDPVRVRPAPNGTGMRMAAQDLPVKPKVREVTPEGLLGFDGRDGRRLYVLREDVVTDTLAAGPICPDAPNRPATITGTPKATNQRDAGRSEQGMGTGRRC